VKLIVRLLPLLAALLALSLLAAACGDDDSDGNGDGDTPTPTASPTTSPTDGATPTPTPTNGGTPTPPGETPDDGTSTPTPEPGPVGTPIFIPADLGAFFDQFTESIDYEACNFDPGSDTVDCGVRGIYAPDTPPNGEDITCQVGIHQGEAVLVNCSVQEPLQAIYYALPE
jgi:hypothetical protein